MGFSDWLHRQKKKSMQRQLRRTRAERRREQELAAIAKGITVEQEQKQRYSKKVRQARDRGGSGIFSGDTAEKAKDTWDKFQEWGAAWQRGQEMQQRQITGRSSKKRKKEWWEL